MSHTPAPWIWWTSNSWKRLLHDLGHGRSANVLQPYVCHDGHPDCEVSEDNMNLIAAAPDLLTALRKALPYLDNSDSPGGCDGKHSDCEHCSAIACARAAIAKAEGRQLAK